MLCDVGAVQSRVSLCVLEESYVLYDLVYAPEDHRLLTISQVSCFCEI